MCTDILAQQIGRRTLGPHIHSWSLVSFAVYAWAWVGLGAYEWDRISLHCACTCGQCRVQGQEDQLDDQNAYVSVG